MWPEAKGKSKDNKPDKPGKNRATKAKIKAMSKEAAQEMVKAAQEEQAALDALAAQARAESEAELTLKYEVGKHETAPDAGRPDLIKLPASAGELSDDKVAGVWKSRMMGNMRPPTADQQVQTGPRQALENSERIRINAQHEVMINHVDKMFDHFQNMAYDFNQMNPAPELELTWIRPTVTRENISSWHQSAQYISVFTGRISTRFWTLVVRGTFEGVLAYIIPADKLLAFTTQPTHYVCVVEFVPYDTGNGIVFGTEGRALTEEQLALTYRALLEALITVAQENTLLGRLDLHALGVFDGGTPNIKPLGQVELQGAPSSNADIDYSAKYKQHMADSQTLSTNSFQSTSNSGEFFQDGDQYKSSNSYPPEFSVNNVQNQSQSGGFQGPPAAAQPPASNYQSQSGQFRTQSGAFGTTPAASQSDDDWKPVARPGRGFDGTATSTSSANVGGSGGPLPDPPKGGFSAEALFQSAHAVPPREPQSIAQAISQSISQANPVPQGIQPPTPPATPTKDVPWNFMPTKADQARTGLGTSASLPAVPDQAPQSQPPTLPPLPPLPGSAQLQPPAPPPVVPPVSPLELLGQQDIMSSPNKFGYTRPAPPPPLPPHLGAASAPEPVSDLTSATESSAALQNQPLSESPELDGPGPTEAMGAANDTGEFAMPDSLQVTNMAFLIANEPVTPVMESAEVEIPSSFGGNFADTQPVAEIENEQSISASQSGEPLNELLTSSTIAIEQQADTVFSFKEQLNQLLEHFDREMETVAQRGSEAFAKRDLKVAESMIKLAEEIGELKESLTRFRDEHQDELS